MASTESAQLTAAEQAKFGEYERIIQFAQDVLLGTHPRVKVPEDMVRLSPVLFLEIRKLMSCYSKSKHARRGKSSSGILLRLRLSYNEVVMFLKRSRVDRR